MTNKENMRSLIKRQGYERAPVDFILCPHLNEVYQQKVGSDLPYNRYFGFSTESILCTKENEDNSKFRKYYGELKPGTTINFLGLAFEPGSKEAMHMTRMLHPMRHFDSLEQMKEYPFPKNNVISVEECKQKVEKVREETDALVLGEMQCTIWETAWYLRSMEELMMDMMIEDPKAEFLLDKVTEFACQKAETYAKAGCDILFLGDDVGMQQNIMMSETLYTTWIQPRLKKVIDTARAINPELIIFYHSCGFITPFIPHLIDAGIDVLNPIQPECMNFAEIYRQFGDKLSFYGTIGTQTTMPFGTPEDVRREVFRNLEIAGDKGGLICAPTHMLEPEVPWENIEAYVKACEDFKGQK